MSSTVETYECLQHEVLLGKSVGHCIYSGHTVRLVLISIIHGPEGQPLHTSVTAFPARLTNSLSRGVVYSQRSRGSRPQRRSAQRAALGLSRTPATSNARRHRRGVGEDLLCRRTQQPTSLCLSPWASHPPRRTSTISRRSIGQ